MIEVAGIYIGLDKFVQNDSSNILALCVSKHQYLEGQDVQVNFQANINGEHILSDT
jgi:hypothetical protein